ncbi:MAG TPA: hypothetical protein P5121_23800, partial [Caldilineaceae bacterium]|nr:hypothetical protein [Caldilineaceae bacterium]
MGLSIHLTINPTKITATEWAAVYEESLLLLTNFPLPLIRLTEARAHGEKRYLYTTAIVERVGTAEEHWRVIGDLQSRQYAESFQLYRDRERQFGTRQHADDSDILWAEGEGIHYPTGHAVELFGNKTQGYPYHLALLAVAMLIESRFPGQAYVFGDIEHHQVKQMLRWANSVLATPITEPICFAGAQLYQRLVSLYPDPALRLQRFQTLFLGTPEEEFALLLQLGGEKQVIADFQQDLAHYQALNQVGVTRLIAKWLTVTQDLSRLLDLVLATNTLRQGKNPFTLEELLKVLCQHFITIPPSERELLGVFVRNPGSLMTIQDAFMQFVLAAGAPSTFDFFMERAALLDLFATHAPDKRERFRQIIEDAEASCREQLQGIATLVEQLETQEAERTQAEDDITTGGPATSADMLPEAHSSEVAYIFQQVARQQEDFP